MRTLLFLPLALGAMQLNAQEKYNLPLKESYAAVGEMRTRIAPQPTDDVFSIPEGLTSHKAYVLPTSSNKDAALKGRLHFLSAYDKKGERLIFLDTDNDGDFKDEKGLDSYHLKLAGNRNEMYTIRNVEYLDPASGKVTTTNIKLYPEIFSFQYEVKDKQHHFEVVIKKEPRIAVLDNANVLVVHNKGILPVYDINNSVVALKSRNNGRWNFDMVKDRQHIEAGPWVYSLSGIDPTGENIELSKTPRGPVEEPNDRYSFAATKNDIRTNAPLETEGKILILDFWGTWCAPCKSLTPSLKEFHASLDTSKFKMLGIALDQDSLQVKRYLIENNIQWQNMFVSMRNVGNTVISDLKVSSYPTLMVIDNDGKILFRESGTDALQKLRSKMKKFSRT